MFGKVRDAAHHCWTEDDAADDFGNDSRLTYPFEYPAESRSEAENDEQLYAEECDGLCITGQHKGIIKRTSLTLLGLTSVGSVPLSTPAWPAALIAVELARLTSPAR